jgi:hypothetical protein
LALPADLLTDSERREWAIRNHVSRELPELGIGSFIAGSGIESMRRIAVSAPSYSSDRAAVVYAEFVCGGACGEGFLVRLQRQAEGWRLWRVKMLWIS